MQTQTLNTHSTKTIPPCEFTKIKGKEFRKAQLARLADTLAKADKRAKIKDVDETDGKFWLVNRDLACEKDEPGSKAAMIVMATVMISTFLMSMSAMAAIRTDKTTMADAFRTSIVAQSPADLEQIASLSLKRKPRVKMVISRGLTTEFVVACFPGEGIIASSRVDRTFCTPDANCFHRIDFAIKNLCK